MDDFEKLAERYERRNLFSGGATLPLQRSGDGKQIPERAFFMGCVKLSWTAFFATSINRTSGEICLATSDSATASERSRQTDFGAESKQRDFHSRIVRSSCLILLLQSKLFGCMCGLRENDELMK
ncbi:hypothetical protein [Lihuaxuella thermophila]|uniref:Uncharacterized protein n=1 Tax=Lihuaxuella thermophila TaxID=1173111 RepID=A0A1H8CM88_9BACL|nr:hypothetical protein [Lihuaxuella thermophila]SEM96381.1 hypothetical protein SAMN05444955_10414 [Lihuaxuella thermophila]